MSINNIPSGTHNVSFFDEYQRIATSTAIYPGRDSMGGIVYCALKLNGEAGEVADKVGKALRDNEGAIDENRRHALLLELGDVLWYIAALAAELDCGLSDVALLNVMKLQGRKVRGTLQGSGDNR